MKDKKMSLKTFVLKLKKEIKGLEVKEDLYFKDLTTIRIGGKIKFLIEIKKISTLMKIFDYINKYQIDFFILGQGSNLLVSDKIFKKLVLKICLYDCVVRQNKMVCGAGLNLFKINHLAIKSNLSGLEWSYGIPGSIGGAVKMNAGSFGGEIKDVIDCVYYTDGKKIYKKKNKSLGFSYRKSFFSDKNFVILNVVLNLTEGNASDIEKLCFQNFEKRRKTQPYNLPSAGSVFKRPKNQFAPVLIERCSLKGLKCGGAQISPKHCGFIVNNNGKASFGQVFKLISKIKKTVLKKFDIILEEEIIILK